MIRIDQLAFVFIGCGPYARTYRCEMAIESLVKVCGWKGKIYLITDSPECFDLSKLQVDAGSDNIVLKSVSAFSDKWDMPIAINGKFPFLTSVPAKTVQESKVLKASIFEYIDEDVALYCDSDVLFTRNELLEEVIALASEWEDVPGIKLRIKDHQWQHSNNDPHHLHTGFMIAHRKYSKEILDFWKEEMQDSSEWKRDPYDRTKFLNAFNKVPNARFYPLPDFVEKVYNFKTQPAFAAHITIARIMASGYEKVESFIAQFNLKSCPEGYYSLPGMSKLRRFIFYLGYIPYRKNYKIEDKWKRKIEK